MLGASQGTPVGGMSGLRLPVLSLHSMTFWVHKTLLEILLSHTTIDWRELGIPSALPYISLIFHTADLPYCRH